MANPVRCPTKGVLEIERDGKQFGTYVATLPVGHSLDDVLSPEYFGQMQARGPTDKLLREGDFIDVRPSDWTWYVRLMVRACLPTVDKVITGAVHGPITFDVGTLPKGWSMKYMGIERKWTIFYRDVEKAAMFRSAEAAREKIIELGGEPEEAEADPAPKKRGRQPRAATDTQVETEAA
jgi:hypothetical protein